MCLLQLYNYTMVRQSGQAEVPVAKDKAKMVQQNYVEMFDYRCVLLLEIRAKNVSFSVLTYLVT